MWREHWGCSSSLLLRVQLQQLLLLLLRLRLHDLVRVAAADELQQVVDTPELAGGGRGARAEGFALDAADAQRVGKLLLQVQVDHRVRWHGLIAIPRITQHHPLRLLGSADDARCEELHRDIAVGWGLWGAIGKTAAAVS